MQTVTFKVVLYFAQEGVATMTEESPKKSRIVTMICAQSLAY
jgi:hypothetical protein